MIKYDIRLCFKHSITPETSWRIVLAKLIGLNLYPHADPNMPLSALMANATKLCFPLYNNRGMKRISENILMKAIKENTVSAIFCVTGAVTNPESLGQLKIFGKKINKCIVDSNTITEGLLPTEFLSFLLTNDIIKFNLQEIHHLVMVIITLFIHCHFNN